MGRRKKRPAPNARERIFCYYCDRNFQQEQELLAHQKEKHLRCPLCNKRLLSVQSLLLHAEQMHNTRVTAVPNAIPGRESVAVNVLGMNGIPDSFYASFEDAHHPKRSRDAHLSPFALPHPAPTNAYVDARLPYAASSPTAPLAPYSATHLYSYPQQSAPPTASYPQHGTQYNYSAPAATHAAPTYAYAYNASQPSHNAPQPLYSSSSPPQPYTSTLDAAPYANYAPPASYNYQSTTRLPPLRSAYPAAPAATTQPEYVPPQPPASNASGPYAQAEPVRAPPSNYNHYTPQNGGTNHQQHTYAPPQLYASPPSTVAAAPALGAAVAVPVGKLIYESSCSPEENRAQLPRYMTKPRYNSSACNVSES